MDTFVIRKYNTKKTYIEATKYISEIVEPLNEIKMLIPNSDDFVEMIRKYLEQFVMMERGFKPNCIWLFDPLGMFISAFQEVFVNNHIIVVEFSPTEYIYEFDRSAVTIITHNTKNKRISNMISMFLADVFKYSKIDDFYYTPYYLWK